MEIKVKASDLFYSGKFHKTFNIDIKTNNASINEDCDEKGACELAVSLLEDTLLDGCWREEIVGKLIGAGIIDIKMIKEYLEADEDGWIKNKGYQPEGLPEYMPVDVKFRDGSICHNVSPRGI